MLIKFSKCDTQIVNRIKLYLQNIDDTRIKNMKIVNVINLMNFLSNNIEFIEKHPKFKICVINKCNSLKNDTPDNIPPSLLENFNKSINKVINLLK